MRLPHNENKGDVVTQIYITHSNDNHLHKRQIPLISLNTREREREIYLPSEPFCDITAASKQFPMIHNEILGGTFALIYTVPSATAVLTMRQAFV